MTYMLLIHQGDTPAPPSDEWERLSKDEQQAIYGAYKAINEAPGVSPDVWMQPPETATTVRVQDEPQAWPQLAALHGAPARAGSATGVQAPAGAPRGGSG